MPDPSLYTEGNNRLIVSHASRRIETDQAIERDHAPGRSTLAPLQRFYALLGVALGYVLLILPGMVMRRRYLAWRRGDVRTPGIAGPLGALLVWGGLAWLLAAQGHPILALLAALVLAIPSMAFATRG
jgi:hypothetical protein